MNQGQYIQRIQIESLWNGQKRVDWNLSPDVNILSGVNGVGKSTILNRVIRHLLDPAKAEMENDGVTITFYPDGADSVDFDVIRSIDRPALTAEFLSKMTGSILHSELDFLLYQLQRKYLDYQLNLSTRIIQLFTSQDPEAQQKAQKIAMEKQNFLDIVDGLFKDTGKVIQRDKNEIFFTSLGETIEPYKLSSGEKQMLIILLTVLVQGGKPYVLFMDEPEVSLHVEWQQRLISLVRVINPNVQIILVTHSPAVIMDGWGDCVTDVEDIVA